MSEEVLWRTSILGLHVSVAAPTHGDEWLDGTAAPDATYLAWLDFRSLGWSEDPSIRALDARLAGAR
jgi:cysteine-S-conjugate beta-lyase